MLKQLIGAIGLVCISVLVLVSVANAQETSEDDDSFTFQVNQPLTVAAGESTNTVIVINDDATIDGTIEDTLVVIDGVATVIGEVGENVIVIEGTLNLESTAVVDNITLFSSDLNRADGATVNGEINEDALDFSLGFGFAVLFALWWIGVAIVTVAAGILFAWLGRGQLYGAVETVRSQFVPSLITAILIWIILPIISFFILFTVIGTPLGLASFAIMLPLLLLLGLCVIGAWIGSYILKPNSAGNSIGGTTIGVILLMVASLIPFVVILVALAAMLGSGGLIYRTLDRARGSEPPTTEAPENLPEATESLGQS